MDTSTMIERLEALLEEYEISNGNALCVLTFQSIEKTKYCWDGEKLTPIDELKREDQFPNH